VFGPPHAVLNLSRIGYRYFRIYIKASPNSQERLIETFTKHPNVGWIFRARGYFNIGIGFWAKDNAEINDISQKMRGVLSGTDEIVGQSELTSLIGFGNRVVTGSGGPYTILDSTLHQRALSPIEDDYIKLLAIDSSLTTLEYSKILNTSEKIIEETLKNLRETGIIIGYQERLNYPGYYCKVFIDSVSAKNSIVSEKLEEKLWTDPQCVYIERANAKYDIEFEIVLKKISDLKKYVKDFSDVKTAIVTENCYTNLYPINKVANVKEIKDSLKEKTGAVIDLRNSKLWYLNHTGAEAYLDMYKGNKDYFETMEHGELKLYPEVASYIRTQYKEKKFNFVDIGSGNGMKARNFIETLGENVVKAYYPIDIQPIELAVALGAHTKGNYAKHPTYLDIENIHARFPLKDMLGERQIYLFTGGTYGNFEHSVINSHLKGLLQSKSTLVVTMPIIVRGKSDADIIKSYSGLTFDRLVLGPLLQAGFSAEDFVVNKQYPEMHAHFEMRDRNLISELILKHDVTIDERKYQKGTKFEITTSWKPTFDEFKKALEKDFVIKKMFSNKDIAIAVIEKSR
jgi:uncharacterized SAM-dependent methyltransferase/DNA-binding Lrp family transcriptional regulator